MLKKIEEETGTAILQRNGQRIFGPPPSWSGPVPERGTELYCFRIPRDCYEVSQELELLCLGFVNVKVNSASFRRNCCRCSAQLVLCTSSD